MVLGCLWKVDGLIGCREGESVMEKKRKVVRLGWFLHFPPFSGLKRVRGRERYYIEERELTRVREEGEKIFK